MMMGKNRMTDKIRMIEKTEKMTTYFVKVTKNSATRPIRKKYFQLKKQLQFRHKIGQWIKKNVNKLIKILSEKPVDLRDYIELRNHYIAKKLLCILLIVVICLPIVYIEYLKPKLEGKLWVPTFAAKLDDFSEYTGPAKLVSEDARPIYIGNLQEGRCSGSGKLYDLNGNLIYNGEFLLDQYNGKGEKYYSNGNVEYKGDFVENQFHGNGSLYDKKGNLIYEGSFVQGNYEGRGILYYEEGRVKYEGDFLAHKYNGEGLLYTKEGKLDYKGQFKNGEKEGIGTVFHKNGSILYEGNFARDYYEGEGKAYDQYGNRIYQGTFKNGKYNGLGILYDQLGREIYKGTFKNGKINYLYYLGLPVDEVRNAFLIEPQTDILIDEFCMTYNPLQITFAFNFAAEEEEAKVKSILFWNEENSFETKRESNLIQLKKLYGEPVEEGEIWVQEKDIALLSNKRFNEILHQDVRNLNILYMIRFIKDNYYVTFYLMDEESKYYLYSEIEECTN